MIAPLKAYSECALGLGKKCAKFLMIVLHPLVQVVQELTLQLVKQYTIIRHTRSNTEKT